MSRWRLWWKAFYSIPSLALLLASLLTAAWLDNAGLAFAGLLATLLLVDRLARTPAIQQEAADELDAERIQQAWEQVAATARAVRNQAVGQEAVRRLDGIRQTAAEIVKAYGAADDRRLYTPLVLEAMDAVQVYYRLVQKRLKLARALHSVAGPQDQGMRHLDDELRELGERLEDLHRRGVPDQAASLERQIGLRQMEMDTYRRYVRHLEEIDLRLEETRALLESVRARVMLSDLGHLEETGRACHELLGEMNALDQAVEQLAELRQVRL